jgi:hypothetical protein
MNRSIHAAPRRDAARVDLLVAIAFAALMLALKLGGKAIARLGGVDPVELEARGLMALLGAFLVATGNTIPKRLTPLERQCGDPRAVQALHRTAGWTWVLTGLAMAVAWIALPMAAAGTATLIIVPAAIALIASRWFSLPRTRRPAA